MATWNKIISDLDKLSALADVTGDGANAGDVLIYNATSSVYVPARITETANEIDVTNTNGSVQIKLDAADVQIPAKLTLGDNIIRASDGGATLTFTDADLITTTAGLNVATDLDVEGISNLDNVDIDGTVQIDGTVTVGVDGTGKDVKFFGDTASNYMLYDQSANDLKLVGSNSGLEVGGSLEVTGQSTLTADVEINGATTFNDDVVIGENGSGNEVTIYGTTSGANALWDTSANSLIITGVADTTALNVAAGNVVLAGNLTVTGTTTTISTANLEVEDKLVVLGTPDSAYGTDELAAAGASGGGIALYSDKDGTVANFAGITWSASGPLSGWQVEDTQTGAFPIMIMTQATAVPGGSDDSAGVGSMYFKTDTYDLYLRTA